MPWRQLLNKRLTGALNWHSARSGIHNMEVLDKIIADIKSQNVDHIALTGDLVNIGYDPEFPIALTRIAPLGKPDDVSIIPGNHDAYIKGSLDAMAAYFAPYMQDDDGQTGFPYLRIRGNVALIGVNTGVPTLPFFATGRVGHRQAQDLDSLLTNLKSKGLFRIVMIHHPPLSGSARFGRGLRDAAAFEAVMLHAGAELVLHGHNHVFSARMTPGPNGMIPVLGAGSASAVPGTPHHRAEYTLISIDDESHALAFSRRRVNADLTGIEIVPADMTIAQVH